jgi:hypothetical protein
MMQFTLVLLLMGSHYCHYVLGFCTHWTVPLGQARDAKTTALLEKPRILETDEPFDAMYSVSYDILEPPTQETMERDLEDMLRRRALRFYDSKLVRIHEKCYLVGLQEKSQAHVTSFSLKESLTELSELAGTCL